MIRSCTAAVIVTGALMAVQPAGAAPRHHAAPVPKAVVSDGCGGVHRLQTAFVPGEPGCCAASLGCAEFLSTTTIVRAKAPTRS